MIDPKLLVKTVREVHEASGSITDVVRRIYPDADKDIASEAFQKLKTSVQAEITELRRQLKKRFAAENIPVESIAKVLPSFKGSGRKSARETVIEEILAELK